MSYGRSMLRGYDKSTAKIIAQALHISDYVPLKGGGKKMKIPMSVLSDKKSKKKTGGKMKMSMLKMDKEDKGEKNFKKKGEDE